METKPDSIPRAQDLNNISELAGEYYLIGTFNDTTRELFKDMDSAKDFKVKIECSDNQVTFDFVYQDTVEHKEQSVLSKFDLTDEGPAVLQSPMATLMLKQYKGDQDLIVHYFDKAKGNMVLVQRDMMIMYFLSKEGKPSEESFPVRKIVKDLGLQTEAYKPINNS